MAGLVPAIAIKEARHCQYDRDHRDKPGDDNGRGLDSNSSWRALSERPRVARAGGRDAHSRSSSNAKRPFELAFRPLDHVVELLVALRELGHHHGVDGLIVDLRADLGPRRASEDGGLLVTARRIGVDGAD